MNQNSFKKEKMKRDLWVIYLWSWPVCVIGFVVFFILGPGFIPPPSPSLSAEDVAAIFTNQSTEIRIGVMGALYFSALLLPFYSVVAAEMRKIEGEDALLSKVMWGSSVILVAFFQIIGLLWLLATYRPEINPEIIRAMNDFCWFTWSMLIPTYLFQYFTVAWAAFMDDREIPTWPRWVAFLNLWVALLGAGGILAVFFKNGPFAWNGIVGFWIPVILFGIGNFVNMYCMMQAKKREFSKTTVTHKPVTA